MIITLDIETIPSRSPAVLDALLAEAAAEKAAVTAPANYKDSAKIAEYIAAKHAEINASADERMRKTALDGARGQIAVAAVAINDAEPVSFWRKDWDDPGAEPFVLRSLFTYLNTAVESSGTRPVFVGHNIVGFDLRFIFQRCVVLGVRPPIFIPFSARPWDESVFDTMTSWAGVGNRVSMDKLCSALGLSAKGSEIEDEIDGSRVWDFVQAGRIADVATYCEGDVIRARNIYRRMTFAAAD
ncbi:3'-5' exonuclease family protein [Pseudothauera rhizosphaerae]|uniref:Predicted 3'-5' exonuclease PolB-like domain-containing protein n=1 Tax=Pseudothauera rhizosphaerae TaxID=2565932 RepID=A0A4S4AWH4_9RHOO|nr:hypothetical protein [Pseudothauera rhizosphaerae]THF64351.1 hypothetical protein E6O51_03305 [Pseudothauera rhizosphaerae]